ncbi:MAG: helix-turn-helix transcriptional regulator [Polaromonas sp.]|nr:helix-turn-helix transcriptional regulator [Polaromonas sp.]
MSIYDGAFVQRKPEFMPNIATALKQEIARVARKETRADTQQLKKASAQYRSDIAALKRRVAALEKLVGRLGKAAAKTAPALTDPPAGTFRFSASGLQAQRKRLGLSASEAGLLLGVSDQSVYKWENGKTRPRVSQFAAIADLRSLGKADATARLTALAA